MRIQILTIAVLIIVLSAAHFEVNGQEHWARHIIDGSSKGADGVRLADFDGDGLQDIVTGWEQGGIVRVYKNPGAEHSTKPWPAVTVGTAPSVEDAVFVDLDGDGKLDVVSCCEGKTRQVRVHWAPTLEHYMDESKWKTDSFPSVDKNSCWMFCVPMDVDGKNGIDLVVGSKNPNGQVGWLESPATNTAESRRELGKWKYHRWQDAGWIMSLRSFDMDSDGDQDVLVSDRKGGKRGVYWLENQNNTASQKWKRHDLGGSANEPMFLDVIRQGNQQPQVVCATRNGELLRFVGGKKVKPIPNPLEITSGKAAAWGDINLDGIPDIVHTTNTQSMKTKVPGVAWLAGPNPSGNNREEQSNKDWKPQAISNLEGIKFDRIELLDLDGDGDLDVLTCEERDNLGVIWYENPTRSR